MISIHALREEGDRSFSARQRCCSRFLSTPSARRATEEERDRKERELISIHALREEGDGMGTVGLATPLPFLSTPSARRATRIRRWDGITQNYFYPRPPRGGRPPELQGSTVYHRISIHALREEGDKPHWHRLKRTKYFYPRPPRGGRLLTVWPRWASTTHFYPRPPRGGRPSNGCLPSPL